MINKDTARLIAADWHNGASDPIYAFSSSGAILPGLAESVWYAIIQCGGYYNEDHPEYMAELCALYAYAKAHEVGEG